MSNDTPLIGNIKDLKYKTRYDKCIIVRNMEDRSEILLSLGVSIQLSRGKYLSVQLETPPVLGEIVKYKPEFFLFKDKVKKKKYGIYFNMAEHKNKLIRFNSSVPKVEIINGEEELKDDLGLKENLDKVKEKMKKMKESPDPQNIFRENLSDEDKKGIILKSIDEEGEMRAFDPLRGMGLYVILNYLLKINIGTDQNALIKQTDLVEILNNSQKQPYKIPEGKYNFESPDVDQVPELGDAQNPPRPPSRFSTLLKMRQRHPRVIPFIDQLKKS